MYFQLFLNLEYKRFASSYWGYVSRTFKINNKLLTIFVIDSPQISPRWFNRDNCWTVNLTKTTAFWMNWNFWETKTRWVWKYFAKIELQIKSISFLSFWLPYRSINCLVPFSSSRTSKRADRTSPSEWTSSRKSSADATKHWRVWKRSRTPIARTSRNCNSNTKSPLLWSRSYQES